MLETEELSPLVHISRPASNQSNNWNSSPSAILICGWMDAQLRHVKKYAEPYRRLFPDVPIIIMLSTTRFCFFSSTAGWIKNAKLVQSELLEAGRIKAERAPTETHTVFIHGFSNGGLISLSSLMEHVEVTSPTFPQPLGAVFDSLPGYDALDKLVPAATAQVTGNNMQTRLQRAGMIAGLYSFWYARSLSVALGGRPHNITFAKELVNKPTSWAWQKYDIPLAKCPPRLYLHTRSDQFIAPDSVEKHAEDLQRVNREPAPVVIEAEHLKHPAIRWPPLSETRTRRMVWNTPQHVQIGRAFHSVYWTSIETFLRDALSLVPQPIKSRL